MRNDYLKVKKVLAIILVMVLTMPVVMVSATDSEGFSDVPSDHWAKDAIELMADLGVIEGHGDGTFGPGEAVTREQFSKMMVLTLGLDLIEPSAPFFVDVSKTDWSYKYVETARYYLTGWRTANGDYFRPGLEAVREDMAVAVVKGLGLSVDDVDLSVLDQFTDKGKISANLKPYVAKAVEEGIMVGDNGVFNAVGTLTRAEGATLLARLVTEEKVVYDDTKVTYDEDEDDNDLSRTPTLNATVSNERIDFDWSEVSEDGFSYYKVVAAKYDSDPVYPEDGYMQYIGDVNDTDAYVKAYDTIDGGDVSKILPGEQYYFRICAVYGGEVYSSNVVRLEVPGETQSEPSTSERTSVLTVTHVGDELKLDWSQTDSSNFKYYKLVFSENDSSPVYPGDGYLTYISDVHDTDYYAEGGDYYNGGDVDGKLRSGETYYVSVTAVYKDGERYYPSNTIQITMP